jgi:malate permease and related proteins
MIGTFFSSFLVMFDAVGRIFLIIIVAGLLVRKKIITQEQVKSLATITVNILLPCMLFASISNSFEPTSMPTWWLLPLACVAMMSFGLAMGYLFFYKNYREKQHLFPLGGMQNAIYLVLPIGRFMYPDQFDNYTIYNFLFIIGFTPMAWSIGKIMITGQRFKDIKVSDFLTPPLIASVGTVVLVLLNLNRFVPKLVFDSVKLVGEATIPVSNIVLGATLGGISLKVWPSFSDLFKITFIKYMLIPIATILILHAIGLKESNPLMANMLIIEAAAAPATALILQVRSYGGDKQTIGSIMLISYALCLFTIPFWNAVWQLI